MEDHVTNKEEKSGFIYVKEHATARLLLFDYLNNIAKRILSKLKKTG